LSDNECVPATPFSTGGGGTNFEQAFAATQLVALLCGQSALLLGDDVRLGSVRFQAADVSDVDDLLLSSDLADGPVRTVAVALRHDPTIASGDNDFVALLADIASTFVKNRDACRDGSWRIGLVVAGPHVGARELATLTGRARKAPDAQKFEESVERSRSELRRRFRWFSEALDKAAGGSNFSGQGGTPGSSAHSGFRYELLKSLRVLEQDLEGDTAADRGRAIQQLSGLTPTQAEAAAAWDGLISVVARANPAGATLDEPALRREMPHHPIGPGLRRAKYLDKLTALELSLRGRVRTRLTQLPAGGTSPPDPLHLLREDALAALVKAIGSTGAVLVVSGAPDTGKSALALESIEVLRAGGRHAVAVHASDITGVGTASDPFDGQLADTLGCATTASARYLIVDGAETAADGQLHALAIAAHEAGYRLVVVAREDALEEVHDALTSVLASATPPAAWQRHTIHPVTTDEITQIVAHFPVLSTIATRPRAADLLSRPGIVDTILRDPHAVAATSSPLTELDVYDAFWKRAVLAKGTTASSSGREQAALAVARSILLPGPATVPSEPRAVDALRLDGILAHYSVFSAGEAFATDLYLDFATARLLTKEGLGLLVTAERPRWAMRATRLAIQARLAHEGAAALPAIRNALAEITDVHGARWSDLADEGILGHPAAATLLADLWPAVATDPDAVLSLIRTATWLYCPGGAAVSTPRGPRSGRPNAALDALAPLAGLLCAHDTEVIGLGRKVRVAYDDLLLAYLRGASWHKFPPEHAGTVHTIATILAARADTCSARPPDEAFALLGPDLDSIGRPRLLAVQASHPGMLDEVVESIYSAQALAEEDPVLLADLALAYYIEPGPTGLFSLHEDGVREHSLHTGPLRIGGGPDRGPFIWLLLLAPEEGLRLAHELLRHGAAVRQEQMAGYTSPFQVSARERMWQPATLDLPGVGAADYVGDSQTWYWYRGTGAGPEPCISAAMALEAFADRLIAQGASAGAVVSLIMNGAGSLAECGVAFGALIRRLPGTGPIVADWLRERLIWELENERVTRERRAPGVDGDADDRLGMAANELATQLVVDACIAGDSDQLDRLASTADALLEAASAEDGTVPAHIRLSAALLRVGSYAAVEGPEGHMYLVPQPPADVAEELQPGNAELERVSRSLGLRMNYSPRSEHHPASLQTTTYLTPAVQAIIPALEQRHADPRGFATKLSSDIAFAQSLTRDPLPGLMSVFGPDPACAVAAVILTGDLDDLVTADERDWAVTQLISAAGKVAPFEYRDSSDDQAASRAAARALATAYAGATTSQDDDILGALHQLAAHPVLEVRRTLVTNLGAIWSAPCRTTSSGRCLHRDAADVLTTLIRDAVIRKPGQKVAAPLTAIAEVSQNAGAKLDARVLGPAAAAALDAETICHCPELGDEPHEAAHSLLDAFVAALAGGRADWHGAHMVATEAARRDAQSGQLNLIRDVSSRLVTAGPLPLWHSAVFDAVGRDASLAPVVGGGWGELMSDLLPLVAPGTPAAPGDSADFRRTDLGALLPPGGSPWPTPADLAAILPTWLVAATGNENAINRFCLWAASSALPAAETLDALGILITGAAVATRLPHLTDLFGYLQTVTLSAEDERRIHIWTDTFVKAGDSRFARFQSYPT
jgi:hypothetical protein